MLCRLYLVVSQARFAAFSRVQLLLKCVHTIIPVAILAQGPELFGTGHGSDPQQGLGPSRRRCPSQLARGWSISNAPNLFPYFHVLMSLLLLGVLRPSPTSRERGDSRAGHVNAQRDHIHPLAGQSAAAQRFADE